MLVAELPRLHDSDTETFIEQATERITSAVQQCQWRLGISHLSTSNPEDSKPGCVYKIALVLHKRTHEARFTLGEWPPRLLFAQPPRIPAKPERAYKWWQRLDNVLRQAIVTVRLDNVETLVRKYLPAKPLLEVPKRETLLNYALQSTLDVSAQTNHSSPEIIFPGREFALHQILY